ncbi:unnamed protein product [Tenebrio molitor]|nr:unnamed protein product [Tenebrio molitor]
MYVVEYDIFSHFQRPSRYSNRVLVGSWVNDRAQHTPDKLTKPQYTTSYKDNFGLKVVKHNPNIVWDQIMKTEVQCVVNNNVEYLLIKSSSRTAILYQTWATRILPISWKTSRVCTTCPTTTSPNVTRVTSPGYTDF